jgi:mannose-6-phosphate isomerase-like protein (cupin superfamily)
MHHIQRVNEVIVDFATERAVQILKDPAGAEWQVAACAQGKFDCDGELMRNAIVLRSGQGRSYPMGRIAAVFKADGVETADRYSFSEWWVEPHTRGPGAHAHPEHDGFYVIEGVMSFFIDEKWIDAPKGSFVLVPGGVTHDFENRGEVRAGVLNFSIPGNFEKDMPAIVQWFAEHPPGDTA